MRRNSTLLSLSPLARCQAASLVARSLSLAPSFSEARVRLGASGRRPFMFSVKSHASTQDCGRSLPLVARMDAERDRKESRGRKSKGGKRQQKCVSARFLLSSPGDVEFVCLFFLLSRSACCSRHPPFPRSQRSRHQRISPEGGTKKSASSSQQGDNGSRIR